jgi:HEPN domain-containing protein
MSDSTDPAVWLGYAIENLNVAQASLDRDWPNACLQNAQQAVEKAIKAVIVSRIRPVRRTHNTRELAKDVRELGCDIGLSDDECELIDSTYLPSKYPPDSAMPSVTPDMALCEQCLNIAARAVATAKRLVASR